MNLDIFRQAGDGGQALSSGPWFDHLSKSPIMALIKS
jgi:hypothetical protein